MEFSDVELERRHRIRLSLAAYAYDATGDTILSDQEYDKLSYSIRTQMATWSDQTDPKQIKRSRKLDKFFKTTFVPYSGMWIKSHPELDRVAETYEHHYTPPREG